MPTLAEPIVTCQAGDVAFESVSDRPVLDFVATVAERGRAELEHLRTPADLAGWVREAGLVDDVRTPTAADLDRATELREAAYALVTALLDGTRPPSRARAVVNATAARPGPRLVLGAAGSVRKVGGLDAALAALAADVIDLHAGPDRALLRRCADSHCTRPFVDRSRGQRRRWCGMRGCGDRAKAAAYRARRRAS
jgi:predicted RNA-binding Zn ribbon-like protein